jgi:hypothetical protein
MKAMQMSVLGVCCACSSAQALLVDESRSRISNSMADHATYVAHCRKLSS